MDIGRIQQMRERLLLCCVCMDEYKDPRILPCHHSFCLECLANIVQSTAVVGRYFCCPQCRKDVLIPEDGIDSLPVNFYIVGLKDELDANGYNESCDICVKNPVRSQFYCEQCDKNICRFCVPSHRLEEHPEKANIIRLFPSSASSFAGSNFCETHGNDLLQLFCQTCQQSICVTCACSYHKRHRFIPLVEKLKESNRAMQRELDSILSEVQSANESKTSIEAARANVVDLSNSSLLTLEEAALKACQTIMKKKYELQKKIESSTDIQLAGLADIENKLKRYLDVLDVGQTFLLDLQDDDICLEVIDSYKKYSSSLKEVRSDYKSSRSKVQSSQFTASHNMKATDVSFGNIQRTIMYGKLGSLQSNRQLLYIDPKTLAVKSKPTGVINFIICDTSLKFYLFIVSFLCFIYVFDYFEKTELYSIFMMCLSSISNGAIVFEEFMGIFIKSFGKFCQSFETLISSDIAEEFTTVCANTFDKFFKPA